MSRPKKSLGQHFLRDQGIIEEIINCINPLPDQHLIEIGPGHGALTTSLFPKTRALDLIEIDNSLILKLQQLNANNPNVRIYHQDVLEVDFKQLLLSPEEKLRIFGNLPYNISTELIFQLLSQLDCIADMIFMVQLEVANRITAEVGGKAYGKLGIMVQYYCETEFLFTVPPTAFYPMPKVNSAIIRIVPRQRIPLLASSIATLNKVVSLAFNQRRKKISNSLKTIINNDGLEKLQIDPHSRAEQLSIQEFVKISNFL